MEKQLKINILTILFVLFCVVFYFSKNIFLIAAIGLGFGVILSPYLDIVSKKLKIKRSYATILIIFMIILFFAVTSGLFGYIIVDQANELTDRLPDLNKQFKVRLAQLSGKFPWMMSEIKNTDLATATTGIAKYFLKATQISTTALGGMFFAFILGLYLAVDGQYYFKGVAKAFPKNKRKEAKAVLSKCARVIRTWFRAQLIDMGIIGAITTIALAIIGVKYWAIFGLLTALLTIVPYIGIIIVVLIVSLVTALTDPGNIGWVFLVFFVTQQIESNIILPRVMKGEAAIPEALLLVVMLFFGSWFGILGIFIAPAAVAVALCLYENIYLKNLEP